uniref:(northern house mosquito) hypothetical protein n=1 Tax=Culex pipiens TaxID=7175 RepID=A0A8D8KMI1_CULPI
MFKNYYSQCLRPLLRATSATRMESFHQHQPTGLVRSPPRKMEFVPIVERARSRTSLCRAASTGRGQVPLEELENVPTKLPGMFPLRELKFVTNNGRARSRTTWYRAASTGSGKVTLANRENRPTTEQEPGQNHPCEVLCLPGEARVRWKSIRPPDKARKIQKINREINPEALVDPVEDPVCWGHQISKMRKNNFVMIPLKITQRRYTRMNYQMSSELVQLNELTVWLSK